MPNSFREECGYVEYVRQTLADLKDNPSPVNMMTSEFIDDVVLNNSDDYTFVPKIDITNKNWKDGDVKWISVFRPGLVDYIGQEYYDNANGSQKKYEAKFPILVSVDPSTPMSIDDIKPFFKVRRSNDDGSQRSYTILKLVGMQASNVKDRYIPIYAKVNARGYHVDGYDFYEYGSARIQDQEYFPSVDLVIQSVNQT